MNGVAPALIENTAMLPGGSEELKASASMIYAAIHKRYADLRIEIPLGRLGQPEEIAETVLWMVKTGYVTNKVVGVDGGMFVQ